MSGGLGTDFSGDFGAEAATTFSGLGTSVLFTSIFLGSALANSLVTTVPLPLAPGPLMLGLVLIILALRLSSVTLTLGFFFSLISLV